MINHYKKLFALLLLISAAGAAGAQLYKEHWFDENPIMCVDLRDYVKKG